MEGDQNKQPAISQPIQQLPSTQVPPETSSPKSKSKKYQILGIIVLIILVGGIAGFIFVRKYKTAFYFLLRSSGSSKNTQEYTLKSSEGSCTNDFQCSWAGEGCGGGHGICTNQPDKYKGAISTCDINASFPSNHGYSCGCVSSVNKCGWKK